jgi:hypothetical protein
MTVTPSLDPAQVRAMCTKLLFIGDFFSYYGILLHIFFLPQPFDFSWFCEFYL